MVDKRMVGKEWKDLMQIVSFSRDAQIKFEDDHMKVVLAVAECNPQMDYPEFGLSRCFFCKEVLSKEASTHTEDCSYILAKRIMEDE